MLHCGQLQLLIGLRDDPSQQRSNGQLIIGSQLHVELLNKYPVIHLGIYLHCGQLQSVRGLRAEPSQQRSAVQYLIGSH